MPKITMIRFASVASELRTWAEKDRARLVGLMATWSGEAKPKHIPAPKKSAKYPEGAQDPKS